MLRTLWEILVPTVRSFGENPKFYTTRYHRVWDKKVREISGGLTILSPTKGQWIHKGEFYEERMIPVRICCTSLEIEKIADMTAVYYNQKAVMYYKISDFVRIKTYE